jgi:KDO2-lipid IV(A) lauroyltransferase
MTATTRHSGPAPTIGQRISFLLARILLFPATHLPYPLALASVWPVARLVWCIPSLRRRTRRRLLQVFGDSLPPRELRRIGWRAFRNFVFTAIDAIRLPTVTPAWIAARMDTPGTELLESALSEGRGVIVAVPHLGSWELAGLALLAKGYPFLTFFRRQRNPVVNDWVYRTRARTGMEVIDVQSRAAVRAGRTIAEKNCTLVITPDLRAKTGGYTVTFLGHPTQLPCGPAHYALDANCPVITAEVYRTSWTRHAWRVTGTIRPDPTRPRAEEGRRILQYIADRFTESIRRRPDNYFWFNGRWVLGPEEKRPRKP